MNKKINTDRYDLLIKDSHIYKRRIFHLAAAAIFTILLFAVSKICLISSYKNIPDEMRSACHYGKSKAVSAEVPDFDASLAIENALPDKDSLLSAIDALSADEDTLLSIPEGFCPAQDEELQKIIESFHEEGHDISFILLDIDSGNIFCLDPDSSYYSASTIKGPYVASLVQFSPEIISDDTKALMENTIIRSSNEDFETLHYLYGNDTLYEMAEYTNVPDSFIDEYDWYPYLTPKELTKLWIGIYWYFFEDTDENSEWCRDLYTDSLESFIGSALSDDHTLYTKPGWFIDWEDESRNDAGILLADGHAYILTIMSDAFDSYDALEELAGILGEVPASYEQHAAGN